MKIRREQLKGFDVAADAAFIVRIVDYLRQNHPDVDVEIGEDGFELSELGEDVLHKLVRGGLTRAREYGIEWESSITAFVVLMFVSAPNFDELPAIRDVLMQDIDPESKLDLLWERTTDGDWEAVEAAYDPDAWTDT